MKTELSTRHPDGYEIKISFEHEKESEKAVLGKLNIDVDKKQLYFHNMIVWIPKSKLNDASWILDNKNILLSTYSIKTRQAKNDDAKIGQVVMIGNGVGHDFFKITEILDKNEYDFYKVKVKSIKGFKLSSFGKREIGREIPVTELEIQESTFDYVRIDEGAPE